MLQLLFGRYLWMTLGCIALLYLCYALIASTLPWLPAVTPVSDDVASGVSLPAHGEDGADGPDRVTLIETPADALGVRMQLLRSATSSIDIAYYTILPDASGRAFFGEILRAADRGVHVRIIVDGTINDARVIQTQLRTVSMHENIECRLYNPLSLLTPWKWHALLHDKIILVDGQYLLLGGRNIGDRFFAPAGFTGAITHDRDVLVSCDMPTEDSVLPQTHAYFERLWQTEDTKPVKALQNATDQQATLRQWADTFASDNATVYAKPLSDFVKSAQPTRSITLLTNPIHTKKKVPVIAHKLGELSLGARNSVIIQTPYATASKSLMEALSVIDANAETIMLTNSMASSPNFFAYSNYHSQREKFLQTGVEIFELQTADSIHAKSMVVDRHLSAVGSFNMDDRSFFIDTENMLVIDSEAFAETLLAAMDNYLAQSLVVGQDNEYIVDSGPPALPVSWAKRAGMAAISVLTRLFYFLI